jgi:hypothetical protein
MSPPAGSRAVGGRAGGRWLTRSQADRGAPPPDRHPGVVAHGVVVEAQAKPRAQAPVLERVSQSGDAHNPSARISSPAVGRGGGTASSATDDAAGAQAPVEEEARAPL